MSEWTLREDGQPYASQPLFETACGYCGASIINRTEGRPRKFCDATCRSGSYRKSRPTRRIRNGKKRITTRG